jgi:uncharacterized protein
MAPMNCVGTVISDDDSPTFELVRVKMKADCELRPGTLIRIPCARGERVVLVGRVRSAYENNPNERPESVGVRDTLGIARNYPQEKDSTTIYRLVAADLIEEIFGDKMGSPQTLPSAGSEVFVADEAEIARTLGLSLDDATALHIGETISGTITPIRLKREAIQRHFFIGGTTGSGKSYAMGVLAEELTHHRLPVVFLDTQDEYSTLVTKLGGKVLTPGQDFTIRISSLTDRELLDLIPTDSQLQKDIIAASFLELKSELAAQTRAKFTLDDLVARIQQVGPRLTNTNSSVQLAARRTEFLRRNDVFGDGVPKENWPKQMWPCLAVKCKHLTASRLQTVATALLRELQDLRLRAYIPPYVMVIDEAHLFVPEGEGSACKQIIREGVRIGRHHGICMVLLTQSPVDIDKSVIRQCNTRMIFALEPDQLDAIKGVRADASDEMLRALPKMPRGHCILSGTYESIKHAIPVHVRERRTLDSEGGKAPDIFAEMQAHWQKQS